MNPTPAKPGGTRIPSRRIVLRGAFTAAVVTGTAGALLPLLDHERAAAARPAPAPEAPAPGPGSRPGSTTEEFAEMYRGREIRGTATLVVPAGAPDDDRVRVAAEPGSEIRIDGRPLHVMRRADGTYLSDVRHYESYPTLLETARAAVDELGAAGLAHPAAHRM
ncbi:tyrosinase cofactor [Streptomyces anulatus]|uniref:Tyrosinase cofactor n=1 Tax=Streptomyces anulatus TaxID=1892 RepID=A0ABZ1Z8C4_STRAQ|nr:tyrosinase cofactor [Streptomyces anulatus]QYA98608.1 tyrosinase cofactor [Streptomyces anulatus]WST89842.1 tyrosinase cofactor [Streptomyces anulatus]WSU33491.1 tyrosinase cofactor [Streptomyces anulatus]WSU87591.1 tyrosinase cofactor [Streptomyces anulatus]